MTLPMFPDSANGNPQVNPENIRKAWHKDEWYFSIIDIIAELLEIDYKRAQWYWAKLKERLRIDGRAHLLGACTPLKLKTLDKKMRFTDTFPADAIQTLKDEVLKPNQVRLQRRISVDRGEIRLLHPKVYQYLQAHRYDVLHHFRLPSGHCVDFVATRDTQTMIVECKLSFVDQSSFYCAVGQALSYCAEHGQSAQPCLATYAAKINDYAKETCSKLGIQIISIPA